MLVARAERRPEHRGQHDEQKQRAQHQYRDQALALALDAGQQLGEVRLQPEAYTAEVASAVFEIASAQRRQQKQ